MTLNNKSADRTVASISSGIWQCAEHDEVAAIVFNKANQLYRPTGSRNLKLNKNSLSKWYKGDLAHVLSIADNICTPEVVLESFAKDSRVSVKRALLDNSSVPKSAYAKLSIWAIERNDWEGLRSVCKIMNISDLCAMLTEYNKSTSQGYALRLDHHVLAERLTHQQQYVLPMSTLGCFNLNKALAVLVHSGKINSVSLLDLVQSHPDKSEAIEFIECIADDALVMNSDFTSSWLYAQAHARHAHKIKGDNVFALVEDGCQADLLVDGNPAMIMTAIINGVDEKLLISSLDNYVNEMTCIVESLKHRSMSIECEERIAARLTEVRREVADNQRTGVNSDVVARFIQLARHPLTDATLLRLLRAGSFNSTCAWLRLDGPNGVRANVVKNLLNDASLRGGERESKAFTLHGNIVSDPLNNEALRGALFGVCPAVDGLVDVLIEHYDLYIGSSLAKTSIINALYPVLVKNFGSNSLESPNMRESWESFLTFAGDWNDTATALIRTVVEINDSSKRNLCTVEHSQLEFVW